MKTLAFVPVHEGVKQVPIDLLQIHLVRRLYANTALDE
jgi:hypothetical protein